MRAEKRREKGKLLCRQLCGDVAKIAPKGIGQWDRAWEIVDAPSAEFMIALLKWESTGSEEDLPALRSAYLAVLDAWRTAVAEWEREGAGR